MCPLDRALTVESGHTVEMPINPVIPISSNVLIVEDSETIRGLLRLCLSGLPVIVWEAANGEQGYDLAVRIRPDLILTDIAMPLLDGIEMIELLRQDPRTSAIPVVCCTAAGDLEQTRAVRAGAVLCLEKPIHRRAIRGPVCRILGLPES